MWYDILPIIIPSELSSCLQVHVRMNMVSSVHVDRATESCLVPMQPVLLARTGDDRVLPFFDAKVSPAEEVVLSGSSDDHPPPISAASKRYSHGPTAESRPSNEVTRQPSQPHGLSSTVPVDHEAVPPLAILQLVDVDGDDAIGID